MDVVNAYLPELATGELEKILLSFKSIQEFQSKMVCRVIDRVLDTSVNNFSFSGLEKISKNSAPLYITNHRDIVLDSALVIRGC